MTEPCSGEPKANADPNLWRTPVGDATLFTYCGLCGQTAHATPSGRCGACSGALAPPPLSPPPHFSEWSSLKALLSVKNHQKRAKRLLKRALRRERRKARDVARKNGP